MKARILSLLAIGLLAAPITASALLVSGIACGSGGAYDCVTNISELEFGGSLYDVTFQRADAASVYPSPLPFLNDASTAEAAADAMIAAARDAGFDDGICYGGASLCFTNGFLYFGGGQVNADVANALTDVMSIVGGAPSLGFWIVFTPTPASVPEPSAFALLSFGLASLAFTRRRKRA